MSGMASQGRGPAWPLGTVTVLGAHILDVLGRPVEEIPPGQGSVRLKEIRATAAGTAAGTGVDLAKLGARVRAVGALGDDLLGDIVIAAMARHGVDTAGLIRKKDAQTSATILPIRPNGERPAFHVPGATRLFTRADVDLDAIQDSRALLIGAPDALAGLTGEDLADIAGAARSNGVLVAVDVLHPGRPEDLDRLAPLLAVTDWFVPNADQLLALTGRHDLGPAIKDVIALGTAAVAVTCGADGCLVAGPGHQRPCTCPPSRSRWSTPPAAATASPPACSPGCWPGPRQKTPPGSASPAAPWSRPAWARTPGSRTWARYSAFWSARSRPWPAGSRTA